MNDILTMTAADIATAMNNKQLGVEEVVKAYLDRIQKHDGKDGLNSICELNEDVLRQAREMDSAHSNRSGALYGLPILVKDNIDVKGLHTTAGSVALADNLAAKDAPVIENLRRNGALILGKTNMTEFANYVSGDMPNGYSSIGGQVKNAYDGKDPSGSSSGSAVAVSAGFCAAALGTDTSFSIVGCATVNGVTGYKPAHGALPLQGIIPLAKTLDNPGPITHTVADALLIYNAMRSAPLPAVVPTAPSNLRLAINTFNRDQVSGAQHSMYAHVLDAFKQDGGHTCEVSHAYTPYQRDIMRCEFKNGLEAYLSTSAAKMQRLDEIIAYYQADATRMKYGIPTLLDACSADVTSKSYLLALDERERLRKIMLIELSKYDACLMTGPTNIMHFIGLPSIALRLGMGADHTPRGMILYGANEQRLFSAALTLERYCSPVPPPIL